MTLDDVEAITGKRPAGARYDERKWSVVLPRELTSAALALPGVHAGRKILRPASLPAFVLEDRCPVAVVREFLGGMFGADGHAPLLHRQAEQQERAVLAPPAYSQSAVPEHVRSLHRMMGDMIRLLGRCGVRTEGARIHEYPTRRSASSYPPAVDGKERVEVRLVLPDAYF